MQISYISQRVVMRGGPLGATGVQSSPPDPLLLACSEFVISPCAPWETSAAVVCPLRTVARQTTIRLGRATRSSRSHCRINISPSGLLCRKSFRVFSSARSPCLGKQVPPMRAACDKDNGAPRHLPRDTIPAYARHTQHGQPGSVFPACGRSQAVTDK